MKLTAVHGAPVFKPKKRNAIMAKTIEVGSSTLVSRILGLVRELFIVQFLGATALSDAFFTAYKIPNSLRKIFAEGALSAAFVPSFVSLLKKESKESVSKLTTLAFIVIEGILIGLCLCIFYNAAFIIKLIAPGWVINGTTLQVQSAVTYLRILISFIVFLSSSALLAGVLQADNHFFVPAFCPVLLNIVFIIGLITCLYWGLPATVLCYFILFGGLVQFLLHVAMYYKLHFSFRAFDKDTLRTFYAVIKKFVPCVFAMSIMEINLFITTSLATYLPAGTISLLRYANRFMGIPYGVFAIALSTILLPYFSRIGVYAPKRLSIYFYEAAKLVFYVTVPAALVMGVLSRTLFKTLFFSKKFTLVQVELASSYLTIFLIGLFFFSINKILLNLFYALHDSVSPTVVATAAIGVHYCSSIILLRYYGGAGLAGAFVISAMAQTLLYIFLLHKKFSIRFFLKRFCYFVGKATLQSMFILVFFYAAYRALQLGIGVYCPCWASHTLLDSIVCWLWIAPLIIVLIRVYAQTRHMFGIKLYFLDQ